MSDAAKSTVPFKKFLRPALDPLGLKSTVRPNWLTLTRMASIAFADHDDPSPEMRW